MTPPGPRPATRVTEPLATRAGAARVWCTNRAQGNLGDHVGDDPAAVAANRAALADRLLPSGARGWVWLRQVHGTHVHVATAPTGAVPPEADAAVTTERGLALAVVTADCAPLVVAGDGAVAVAHAGHRGLLAGVVEATVEAVRARGGGDLHAFLGPCIRSRDYEFGAAALAPFVERFGPEVAGRTAAGTPSLDIARAIRVVLQRLGVPALDDCGLGTASSDAYFSYRRDGTTGRQATVAVLP